MNALRRNTRPYARLLAAWMLLWFMAMTAMPMGMPHAGELPEGDICVQADAGHEALGASTDQHAGHGDASMSHCPLCLQAAAPPPPQFAQGAASPAPQAPADANRRSALRVRTDAPPPARGPPALS